jgi:hypothetical protein
MGRFPFMEGLPGGPVQPGFVVCEVRSPSRTGRKLLSANGRDAGNEMTPQPVHPIDVLIQSGEGQNLEFKSSLRWDLNLSQVNKELTKTVAKTVAGFMNGDGGTLLIGVSPTRVKS